MNTLPVHKCSDPECCSFGQVTTKNCGCHKTTEQLLVEQRDALLTACKLLLSSAHDYQTGVAEAEYAIAQVKGH